MDKALNVRFDHQPIAFQLSSPYLIALDPLVLDGISGSLRKIGNDSLSQTRLGLAALNPMLKIGVIEVAPFQPGFYSLGMDDLELLMVTGSEPDVFEVDTGAVVFVDLTYLIRLATAFTWERYDLGLQSPIGDSSAWLKLTEQVGGPYFGILFADADSSFSGDGTYRLRHCVPKQLQVAPNATDRTNHW
jgi:hypothetical protein